MLTRGGRTGSRMRRSKTARRVRMLMLGLCSPSQVRACQVRSDQVRRSCHGPVILVLRQVLLVPRHRLGPWLGALMALQYCTVQHSEVQPAQSDVPTWKGREGRHLIHLYSRNAVLGNNRVSFYTGAHAHRPRLILQTCFSTQTQTTTVQV